MKFKEVCRFCLTNSSPTIPIFVKIENGVSIIDQILECTSIELTMEDDKNSLICNDCTDKFSNFYEFKNICLTNNKIYSGYLQDALKPIDKLDDNIEEEFNDRDDDVSWKGESDDDDYAPSIKSEIEDNEVKEESDYDETVSRRALSRYVCDICNEDFKYKKKLAIHLNAHKKDTRSEKYYKKPTIQCPKCPRKLLNEMTMETHMERYHNEENVFKLVGRRKKRPVQCPVCLKVLANKNSFTEHMMIHENIKPHQCEQCGKSFNKKHILRNHMATHTTEAIHTCEFCSKPFKTKDRLTVHRRLHTGHPYKCKVCGKTFAQSYACKKHEETHERLPNQCKLCNEVFPHKTALSKHRQETHFDLLNVPCEHCNMRFATRRQLKYHAVCHEEERKYHCTACGQGFRKKHVMRNHMKRAHGLELEEKPRKVAQLFV